MISFLQGLGSISNPSSESMQLCRSCICRNTWNLQGWTCCAFRDGRRTYIRTTGYLSDRSLHMVSNQSANSDLRPLTSGRLFPPQKQFVKYSFQLISHQPQCHVHNHSIPPFIVVLMHTFNNSKLSSPHPNFQTSKDWLISFSWQVFFLFFLSNKVANDCIIICDVLSHSKSCSNLMCSKYLLWGVTVPNLVAPPTL